MTVKDFVSTWHIRAVSELVDENPNFSDFKANHYKVMLRMYRGGKVRQFTTYFSKGFGLRGRPTTEEVLDCLRMDITSVHNAQGFEDWASEFGYDTDSRKAEMIYKTIEKQATRLATFLYHGDAWQQFLKLEENE